MALPSLITRWQGIVGLLILFVLNYVLLTRISSSPCGPLEASPEIFKPFSNITLSRHRIPPLTKSLVELLERYEKNIVEARDPNKAPNFKYLIWEPSILNGWGNRFSAAATGFLFGLMTDRLVYFLNWRDVNPVLSRYDVRWAEQKKVLEQTEEGKKALLNQHVEHGFISNPLKTSWLNDDHRALYGNYSVYVQDFSDGDYLAPIFQRNPHFAEFFKDNFPTQEIFFHLFNWMFQPVPEVKTAVMEKEQELYKYKFSVAIQIRVTKFKIFSGQDKEFPYQDFCDLAKAMAVSTGLNASDVIMFVAADKWQVAYPIMEKCLSPYKMTYITPASGRTESRNPGSDISALTDMYLLSKCDEIIVTTGSSFGYIAAASQNKPPWYITLGDHIPLENPTYFRQVNSEPCMWSSRVWMESEQDKNLSNFKKDGLWRQYSMCHPK